MNSIFRDTLRPGLAGLRFYAFAIFTLVAGYSLGQDQVTNANTAAVQEDPVLFLLDIDELYEPLSPEPVYGATAIELIEVLQTKHYLPIEVDDDFSSLVFDNYIDALDGEHLYFLREDIDYLSTWRYNIDDHLREGSLTPGYEIYNLYYKRLLERLIYAIDRVENHIPDMDFTLDEYVVIDREDAPYAETVAELDEIWRLRTKNSVLSLKLAGDDNDEIREKLSERYRGRLNRMLQTNSKDAFQSYLTTVARVSDPHTAYFSPQDSETFNMNLSLSLQGIGAQLTREDEYTTIVELVKGGPAERSTQLSVGDRIIGIGQGPEGEIQDVVGMRLDDVVAQIRGEEGTVVRLNVIPANAVNESSATVVSITRDTVRLEDQSAKSEIIELPHDGRDFKVGIIQLPTFYFDFEAASRGEQDFKSSTRDVRALIEEMKEDNVDAVIVDLRNNGGGSLGEANQLVGLFIDTGATVQVRYSGLGNGYTRSFGDNDPEIAWDGPMAVIVNRNSASASEIFAGAIQDYQRGLVLGGQTFGKGTVQEIIPMEYGQAKLTRSKFYRVSGASTQHRGVVPDITLPDMFQAYDQVGESSLDGALPWDTVRPVEYRAYHPIRDFIPELEDRFLERAANSPDFIYLNEQISIAREQQERETWPLNEETLDAQMEAERRRNIDTENMRRFLKGLPLLDILEGDDEEDSDATETAQAETEDAVDQNALAAADAITEANPDSDADAGDETEADEEEGEADPLLEESARVLADYISLSERQISAVSDF